MVVWLPVGMVRLPLTWMVTGELAATDADQGLDPGEEVTEQGDTQVGAVPPKLVPARMTWQSDELQLMVPLPMFLMVMARATGLLVEVDPPVRDTDTTWMLELVAADPARL